MTGCIYALSILLRFDAIQHRIASFISEKINESYEIPIKVDAIRISRLNEILLKDILIKDQKGDTILWAEKATAHISPLKILNSEIQVNTLTMAAPDARISKESKDSLMNIQFILDKFIKEEKEEKNDLKIRINQLLVYDGKFHYDIYDAPHQECDKLDLSHIDIDDIRFNISLKELRNNNIDLRIRSIRGKEKSGLELQKFKAFVKVENQNISVRNLDIKLPDSEITSDSILVSYDKESLNSLQIDGEIKSNRISIGDIQALLNEEMPKIPDFSFKIKGYSDSTSANADIKIETLDNSIALNTNATIVSPYIPERIVTIDLKRCDIDKNAINTLQHHIPANIFEKLKGLEFCNMNGYTEFSSKDLNGQLKATTGIGSINAVLNIKKGGKYKAEINAANIGVDKLTNNKESITCNIQTSLIGNINNIKQASIEGHITELEFKDHLFAPISFNGNIDKELSTAEFLINDQYIKANIKANYEAKGNENKKATLSLHVDSLRLGKFGFRENPEELLSFDLNSDLTLFGQNKHLLNAKLNQLTFQNEENRHTLNNLHFCDNYTENERLLMINSDFFNCSVIGEFNLKGVVQSMQDIVSKHLSALEPTFKSNKSQANRCNYIYKFDIKDTDLLNALFKLPASINKQSIIYGACNDEKGIFTLNTRLNNVTFKKSRFRTINIDSYSNNSKLELNANIIKAAKNRANSKVKRNDLDLNWQCIISQNNIENSIKWDNKAESKKQIGKLRLNAELGRDMDGLLTIKAKIHQDSIINNDSAWYISGSSITGNQEKLYIKSMYLYNNDQFLKIDGTAGKSINDSLHINARNLDVNSIMNLANFKILQFDGNATGKGYITNLLAGPDVKGSFNVDSLKIDNGYLGQGRLNIGWENKSKSILLDCDIKNDNNIVSNVSGFLSPGRDSIRLAIDANEINAGFINKMVGSFMSDIKGVGSGKAYILGSWRKVDLVGAVQLNCSARIKSTNVTYYINGDTLYFNKGNITFNNIHAKDRRGNSGWLNGKVTHNHMTNWVCDISVKAENLLAYDTNNFDSAPFYGTVYATGNANITANSNGIFLKAEAKSEPHTRFVYNASQTGSVSDNSFVKFIDSSKKDLKDRRSKDRANSNIEDNINSRLNLDFMLDITEDAMVKVYTNLQNDDYLEIYGKGAINAIYDEKEGFSMKGNIDLDRGTYKITVQDIFTKEFTINKGGTLLFNGDPTEVGLNIRAKHLVPSASLSDLTTETSKRKTVKVNCLMDITGTLKSPNLSFDLELPDGNEEERELLASVATTPEQKNMQFIYLLGIGKFYTYDNNNLQTGDQTTTAVESLISNTLSGQLNNMLGQIINNGNWNISGNFSTSERGWNSMEIEGMLEGRLLNNRLLINSNFGYRENPIANSNFIGDFELQWLLNKNGTVSLKAYSKTNDRYFSKTNLTTQGAGIIFRHDFNNWFWWRKKKEKTSKNKE